MQGGGVRLLIKYVYKGLLSFCFIKFMHPKVIVKTKEAQMNYGGNDPS
jgi:hypothetical protein